MTSVAKQVDPEKAAHVINGAVAAEPFGSEPPFWVQTSGSTMACHEKGSLPRISSAKDPELNKKARHGTSGWQMALLD